MTDHSALSFTEHGAAHFPAALTPEALDALRSLDCDGPGMRLHGRALGPALASATEIASAMLGAGAFPVRAVLFDKTEKDNWAVGWHQDRTIAVRARGDAEGFGPWTVKQGIVHVAPPIEVLNGMATLRLHIDDCGPDNAPLHVVLGSHRLGRVADADAATEAGRHERHVCLADAGDVWAYATPILHASERASRPSRRRVLQLDFATTPLPAALEWLGIDG